MIINRNKNWEGIGVRIRGIGEGVVGLFFQHKYICGINLEVLKCQYESDFKVRVVCNSDAV